MPRRAQGLTAAQVDKGTKPGRYGDGAGLYLLVRAREAKFWLFRYKRAGRMRKTQKQARAEILPAGAAWFMVRSANAGMMALRLAGVEFCRPFEPPALADWEGPFADPNKPLPQEPTVAAERREAQQRYRQRYRERKAAPPATGTALQSPNGEAAP